MATLVNRFTTACLILSARSTPTGRRQYEPECVITIRFLNRNAGHTVRRLKLLCQKTSHQFTNFNNRAGDGRRTIGAPNCVRSDPLAVCVTITTEWPSLENSSANSALTVSIPPRLGANACDEIRIFTPGASIEFQRRSRGIIIPNCSQHLSAFFQLRARGGIGALSERKQERFNAMAHEKDRLD